jgi:hypothetical protein
MSQLVKKLQDKFKRKADKDRVRQMSTQRTASTTNLHAASAQYTATPTTMPQVLRRRSPRSHLSPVLVRVDTRDRFSGEPEFVSSESPEQLDRPPETNPIPIPLTPSTIRPVQTKTTQKRLHSHFDTASVKRRKSGSAVQFTVPDATVLSPLNGNVVIRQLVRFQEAAKQLSVTDEGIVKARAHIQQRNSNELLSCLNARCPFSKSIVFLSSCVRGFQWVSDTLLKWHGAEQTTELRHWSRAAAHLESTGCEVSESLSFPDHHKLVLIESNRLKATFKCIDHVKDLRIRDPVLYFDWRVLEDWQDLEIKASQHLHALDPRKLFEQRYFGFTCWSSKQQMTVFLHKDIAKMPSRWLDE